MFAIFIHRKSKCSLGLDCVQFDDIKMASLLFTDDVVLLALSDCHLQCALEWCTSECDTGRMRIVRGSGSFPEIK